MSEEKHNMSNVKKLRKTIGLKQKDLAFKLEINKGNYSNMENGTFTPKNIKEVEQKAIKLMLPVLIQKIIDKRDELDALESFSLQFKA